jgi:hypothetical protein
MSQYSVRFEWRNTLNDQDEPFRELEGASFEDAKVGAALLYACEPFKGPPPSAYTILQNGVTEVYCYPETNVRLLR